jgi:hypothetical protein
MGCEHVLRCWHGRLNGINHGHFHYHVLAQLYGKLASSVLAVAAPLHSNNCVQAHVELVIP